MLTKAEVLANLKDYTFIDANTAFLRNAEVGSTHDLIVAGFVELTYSDFKAVALVTTEGLEIGCTKSQFVNAEPGDKLYVKVIELEHEDSFKCKELELLKVFKAKPVIAESATV